MATCINPVVVLGAADAPPTRLFDRIGIDRVVLGSNHPFAMARHDPVEAVGLAPAQQRAVLGKTPSRLLNL